MLKGRANKDPKSRSPSPREVCMDRHGHPSIHLPPMRPPPEHRTKDQLPRLSTLELPTQVTSKNLLQGQLKGADQDSKSRINSPREPDPGRHHRDRIGLTFMQPAQRHQPERQLPSIGKLRILSDTTSTSLGPLQRADSSDPPRGQSKRTREEAPRQEAPEQPYQPAYENRKPAPRYPSIIAPPKHKCAGYEVPCGPAGITPNRHREMSRGQSERNPQVPPQEARKQQYQSSYKSFQATKRHRSERAAPPTNKSACYDVGSGPTGITRIVIETCLGGS